MRRTMLVGVVLTVTAVLVVVVSAALDLELEPVAVLGVALGAVLALVPDRAPALRIAGFTVGFAATWLAYFLRAGVLPDSPGGRAVAVVVVFGLATLVAAATANRVPLWSTLVGAAALAGAYEVTYTAAPPEVATTSVSAATAVLMAAAVGFLAAAAVAPEADDVEGTTPRAGRRLPGTPLGGRRRTPEASDSLDDMMEKTP